MNYFAQVAPLTWSLGQAAAVLVRVFSLFRVPHYLIHEQC